MNEKNSLGIDLCFKDLNNPIDLFGYWFNEAKKTEINDPNALSLATVGKNGIPSVRMVLLKTLIVMDLFSIQILIVERVKR